MIHATYSEGGSEFTGYMREHGKPSTIARRDTVSGEPYVVVDIPDAGACREGLRLEMDEATADLLAKAIRRVLTEYRRRSA